MGSKVEGVSGVIASLTGLPIQFTETSDGVTLDFTMFQVEFYKGTAGYNKIYDRFGNVLVYDDRIILEYLSKAPDTWKQRGTPTGITWVKVSDCHYEVTRHYTDYLGTTYDVKYTVKSDSPLKITITLNSGKTDTYRIAWTPSGIVKTDWVKSGNRFVFGNEAVDYGWVGFDWEDVYQSLGDITTTSVESVAQGKKANIYFNVGTVNAGQSIIVDPSIVDTSEDSSATAYNGQRKVVRTSDGTLYAVYPKQLAGYYQIYVKKSVDGGATWTDETRISTYTGMESKDHYYPSIAVDSNNYLHVIWRGRATGIYYSQIWYAKYTTSWATPVYISTYAGMDSCHQYNPSIAVDSSNYLHVVWYGKATGYTTYLQVWYAEYTTSWATPVRISTYAGMDSYDQSYPSIAVDSSNYLHVVWYGYATGYITSYQIWYAKYTNAWQAPVRISTYAGMDAANYQHYPSIAVDSNDYLHVVWHGCATGYITSYQIWYAKYTNAWQAPVRISTYAGMDSYDQTNPSIAVDSSNQLHVMWHGKATGHTIFNKVWYAKYTISWAAPTVLQPTGQNQYPNLRWSFHHCNGGYLHYVFTEGTASPYNVKFDKDTSVTMPGGLPPPSLGRTKRPKIVFMPTLKIG